MGGSERREAELALAGVGKGSERGLTVGRSHRSLSQGAGHCPNAARRIPTALSG